MPLWGKQAHLGVLPLTLVSFILWSLLLGMAVLGTLLVLYSGALTSLALED